MRHVVPAMFQQRRAVVVSEFGGILLFADISARYCDAGRKGSICLLHRWTDAAFAEKSSERSGSIKKVNLHREPAALCPRLGPGLVFSYKVRYIVGFELVEMTISTNPLVEMTISAIRNLRYIVTCTIIRIIRETDRRPRNHSRPRKH